LIKKQSAHQMVTIFEIDPLTQLVDYTLFQIAEVLDLREFVVLFGELLDQADFVQILQMCVEGHRLNERTT
jgi:hypothetical protein